MPDLIVGPEASEHIAGALAAAVALGFGLGLMVHSVAYVTTAFKHFVDEGSK